MPKQMPSSGLVSTSFLSTGTRPVASSLAMASPKAPTPGSRIWLAACRSAASWVTRTSAPRLRTLDDKLNRFPTP